MMLTIYGIVTLALIIAFIGLCIWAYTPSRNARFIADANIPFIDNLRGSDHMEKSS